MNELELQLLFTDEWLAIVSKLEDSAEKAAILEEPDKNKRGLILAGMGCAFDLVKSALEGVQTRVGKEILKMNNKNMA